MWVFYGIQGSVRVIFGILWSRLPSLAGCGSASARAGTWGPSESLSHVPWGLCRLGGGFGSVEEQTMTKRDIGDIAHQRLCLVTPLAPPSCQGIRLDIFFTSLKPVFESLTISQGYKRNLWEVHR